ncbi:MAG: hypothetical protein K9N23_09315 [Akkermansiaceae bacterium]|nr:hypothetical protein [Akkermansiaceae bacterium]MCF7731876.1 hypothetical protein [Akkermansiaceae bacterium]
MTTPHLDERVKPVLIAMAILLGVSCGVVGLWLGWMHIPGPLGEFVGMVVGVMSTPFFLEASFVIAGILILMLVNAIQRQRDGDEFVTPEQLQAREAAATRTPRVTSVDPPVKHP